MLAAAGWPVQGDMYSDDEPSIRRLSFAAEGQKRQGNAEIRFLETGPDQWVSAVSYDIGYGKMRHEPLRSNVTYRTAAEAILDAANLVFTDMGDHADAGNKTLAKTANAVMTWADGIISEHGGPRTVAN